MPFPLPQHDLTCLITGASSGIGADIARELAERGHNVTLAARRGERLEQLAAELTSTHGIDATPVAIDVTDAVARNKMIDDIEGSGKSIGALVNNAGCGTFGNFQRNNLDQELASIDLNVDALVALTHLVIDGMVERGSGAILNVASTAAFQPVPRQAVYAATKAFVTSFSNAVHEELAGTGVTCTCLHPGPVRTEFMEVAGIDTDKLGTPDFLWSQPRDVARAGVEAMIRGRRTVIPGPITNRLSSVGGQIAPRSLLMPLMRKFYPAPSDPR